MKILRIISYFSFLFLLACVGSDTAFLPDTIELAKKDRLLIHIYAPSQKKVIINKTEYHLENAFTTFKFNSKKDLTINRNFFAFIIKLENLKTHEKELNILGDDYNIYVNFNAEKGGIHDSNLSIDYDDISTKENLDTIKIGFRDHYLKEITVKFIKIK